MVLLIFHYIILGKQRISLVFTENTSSSTLWDDQNNTYANINFDALISDSNKKPPLPVVYIYCGGSGFTKAVYEAIGANPTEYSGCTFNYYDPNSTKGSAVSTVNIFNNSRYFINRI